MEKKKLQILVEKYLTKNGYTFEEIKTNKRKSFTLKIEKDGYTSVQIFENNWLERWDTVPRFIEQTYEMHKKMQQHGIY